MTLGAIVPPGGRGCGFREEGGVYLEVGLGKFGMPLEAFLLDPPIIVTKQFMDNIGATPRGVHLFEREGVWHVFDWVGAENYPNVCDILEEGRRFGFSRRCELASADEYAKLTADSKMFLVHPKGYTGAFEEYVKAWAGEYTCVKGLQDHEDAFCDISNDIRTEKYVCCSSFWWQDVACAPLVEELDARSVQRTMPSFGYSAYCPSCNISKGCHAPAFIAALPITRLVVVNGSESAKKLEKASKAQLAVEMVNE